MGGGEKMGRMGGVKGRVFSQAAHMYTTHTHTQGDSKFFNFVKASIGSGSFALLWGILQCGAILGSFGMVFLGLLRYVCCC